MDYNEKLSQITSLPDYTNIQQNIEWFLKNMVLQKKADGVVFGLSGGIDSAVIAYLCADVIKDKTTAIIMPDSKISPESETDDALKIVDELKLNYKLIDINQIHKEYYKILEPQDLALGNLRARIRTNILYYYSNSKNILDDK